jgi:hypothetical protein
MRRLPEKWEKHEPFGRAFSRNGIQGMPAAIGAFPGKKRLFCMQRIYTA